MPHQRHSSSADWARELFKGLNGWASLLVCTQKKILVGGCGFFVSDVKSEVILVPFARKKEKSCNIKFPATSRKYKFSVFQKLLEAVKSYKKLPYSQRLKTSLTSSKIKPVILFMANQNFSTNLIFRSQEIWGDKNTFQLSSDQLCVKHCLIHLEGLQAARLTYSSPSTTVALENVHLPTTWQESELMFHNNGLLRHKVIIAAGLLS